MQGFGMAQHAGAMGCGLSLVHSDGAHKNSAGARANYQLQQKLQGLVWNSRRNPMERREAVGDGRNALQT